MAKSLRTQLKWLKLYVLVSAPLLLVLSFAAFQQGVQSQRFHDITVERINVVEKDGTLRMTLSGQSRSPANVMNGKTFGQEGNRPAGIIFYNDEGSETGGLIFGGKRDRQDSTKYENGVSLTFDQFNQDQVVALQHIDEQGQQVNGLSFLDRPHVPLDLMIEKQNAIRAMPNGPARDSATKAFVAMQKLPGNNSWGVPRMFVGRDKSAATAVRLNDPAGHVRIRMEVDSTGAPRLEFLDAAGKVTYRIPADGH